MAEEQPKQETPERLENQEKPEEPAKSEPAKKRLLTRRRVLTAGLAAVVIERSYDYLSESTKKAKVVIVGGGTAGLTVAALLEDKLRYPDITIMEPNDDHHYQPGYTMIAGGVFEPGDVIKPTRGLIPSNVKWMQDSVAEVNPEQNTLVTRKNGKVTYDFLVLVPGCEMDFGAIQGISRDELGKNNVHCIYDYQGAIACRDALRKLPEMKEGKLVFTTTHTKLKCGGAPKKVMLMAEHGLRRSGIREKFQLAYYTPESELMKPKVFGDRLVQIFKDRSIPISYKHKLVAVDGPAKKAVFERPAKAAGASPEKVTVEFDLLHFVPPMSAPAFLRNTSLTEKTPKGEWVKVDKDTLVHTTFKNIISLGDVAGLPTSKTGAAIRKQAPVAAKNLVALMEGKTPPEKYNGYSACPIVTEYGKVLMCEFGYDEKLMPTLPWLDPAIERGLWWTVKAHVLRPLYFHGIVTGWV